MPYFGNPKNASHTLFKKLPVFSTINLFMSFDYNIRDLVLI